MFKKVYDISTMSAILTCGISVTMGTESQGASILPTIIKRFWWPTSINLDTMVHNLIYLHLHAKTSRQF